MTLTAKIKQLCDGVPQSNGATCIPAVHIELIMIEVRLHIFAYMPQSNGATYVQPINTILIMIEVGMHVLACNPKPLPQIKESAGGGEMLTIRALY